MEHNGEPPGEVSDLEDDNCHPRGFLYPLGHIYRLLFWRWPLSYRYSLPLLANFGGGDRWIYLVLASRKCEGK